MQRYGLLGEKLGHSYSPQIHAQLASYPYDLYEVAPERLDAFLRMTELAGMNVTIPYKKAVIPYCKALSPAAARIGSVNTLVRRADGWYGDNTDYDGFCYMARDFAIAGKKALVAGQLSKSGAPCRRTDHCQRHAGGHVPEQWRVAA